jgi:hypothetical protein
MGSLAQALNGGFRAGVMIFAFVYVLLLTLIPVVLYFTTHYVRPVAVHGREMVEVLDRIDAIYVPQLIVHPRPLQRLSHPFPLKSSRRTGT